MNVNYALKKAAMIFIAVVMMMTFMPGAAYEAFAMEPIATMNGDTYWHFKTLVNDLEDMEGKSVTIDMLRDWDKSSKAVYYINLTDGKHDVIIKDLDQSGKERTRTLKYSEGDEVVFTAEIPTDKEFSSWTVRDDKDRDVTDKIYTGDYAKYKTDASTAFVMPAPDDQNGFSDDYTLTFTANYGDKISLITPTLTAPVAEEDLGEEAEIVFNTIEGKTFKIKAKGKGACYVYDFAHNGLGRKVNGVSPASRGWQWKSPA